MNRIAQQQGEPDGEKQGGLDGQVSWRRWLP
jgi:hypothetical protein